MPAQEPVPCKSPSEPASLGFVRSKPGAKPSEFGAEQGKARGDGKEFKHIPPRPEGLSCRKSRPPDGAP